MKTIAITLSLLCLSVPCLAQTFTLDAVANCPGLGNSKDYVLLGQTYYIEWVSGAWSPLSDDSQQGGFTWESRVSYYDYGTGQTGVIGSPASPGFYPTAQQAEAAALGIYTIQGHGSVVSFYLSEVGPSAEICDDNRGSVTLRFVTPTPVGNEPKPQTELLSNIPNPFNPSTLVRFSLAQRSHVRIEVYDVSGKRVATLVDEVRPAGPQQVSWNGMDTHSRRVASGVYLIRMSTEGETFTRKMVLLK